MLGAERSMGSLETAPRRDSSRPVEVSGLSSGIVAIAGRGLAHLRHHGYQTLEVLGRQFERPARGWLGE